MIRNFMDEVFYTPKFVPGDLLRRRECYENEWIPNECFEYTYLVIGTTRDQFGITCLLLMTSTGVLVYHTLTLAGAFEKI